MTDDATNVAAFESVTRRQMVTLSVGFEGGLVVVAFILGWALDERFWVEAGFSGKSIPLGAALSLPLIVGAFVLNETSWKTFRRIRKDFEMIVALFRKCTVLDLLLISILAGVGEEALFRGVLQPFVAHFTGPVVAVLAVSLLFGLVHIVSRIYVVFVFIVGLYLGILFLWFDDLILAITTHAVYDFLALVYGTTMARRERATRNES